MSIWIWIALYLVIGFGTTYLIHKDEMCWYSEDTREFVGDMIGFTCVSLTWPIVTLIPFLYGICLGIRQGIEYKRLMKSNEKEEP